MYDCLYACIIYTDISVVVPKHGKKMLILISTILQIIKIIILFKCEIHVYLFDVS